MGICIIIFDFDGVILESVSVKTEAFRKLFSFAPEHIDEIIQYHKDNGGMSRYDKFRYIYKSILREDLTQQKFEELSEKFADIVFNEKGDRVLTSSGMQVEVAVVNGDVPSWLPEIALRITGDSGQSPDEHAAAYLHFRKHILDDAFNDAWIGWARNLLR